MITIELLLCPISSPIESDEALPFAISLAQAHGAQLVLCSCVSLPVFISPAANIPSEARTRMLLKDALMHCFGDQLKKLNWRIALGDAREGIGEEIVRVACESHADLIVMRSRRSRVPALLGSIAEQVSRTALCPVLITRSLGRESHVNGQARFQRILVPHDFSGASELALSYALSIAQKLKAELHLLHVVPEQEDQHSEISLPPPDGTFYREIQRLHDCVPEQIHRSLKLKAVVRSGKPYREVLTYSKQHGADLICMGALGRDFGLGALFGSNVDRVLRQADCPVLIAQPLKLALHSVNTRIFKPHLRDGRHTFDSKRSQSVSS
ncbi:MAG TPA: universal stress protein [Pyrinomonadaceae bacterium]|nr:universal stress protein [Pyrinomonadaceae bacterium]